MSSADLEAVCLQVVTNFVHSDDPILPTNYQTGVGIPEGHESTMKLEYLSESHSFQHLQLLDLSVCFTFHFSTVIHDPLSFSTLGLALWIHINVHSLIHFPIVLWWRISTWNFITSSQHNFNLWRHDDKLLLQPCIIQWHTCKLAGSSRMGGLL